MKQKSLYAEPREINPLAKDIDDSIKNIIKEVHNLKSTWDLTHKELYIPLLRLHQKGDKFCKNMVNKITSESETTEFDADQNGILCRLVRLQHGWELVSVIPRSLVTKIMYEYYECRGQPGVMKTVSMICRYSWFKVLSTIISEHVNYVHNFCLIE